MPNIRGASRVPKGNLQRQRRNWNRLAIQGADAYGAGLALDSSGRVTIDLATISGLTLADDELAILIDPAVQNFSTLSAAGLDTSIIAGNGITANRPTKTISVLLAALSGLRFSTSTLLVNPGDGLVITGVGSGPLEIDLATNPGLEFNSGQLQVKDGDGIVKTASGVEVDLGLINAGLDFIAGRLQLNFNLLNTVTPTLADEIAIYDVTSGGNRKVTVESLFATNILRAILPVFDAYDSVGYQTINGTASVLNLDTVEVNTDASTFSITNDVITIARTGVLDITVQITEGTTGTSPFEFAAFIRRNGVEIARTRRHSGGEILP